MKQELRKELLEKRDLLPMNERLEKSSAIFSILKESDIYKNASNVMLYIDFRSEVSTKEIINDLLEREKRVFIPLTVPETRQMIISELLDMEKDLALGNFGVLEPIEEAIRPVDPKILDLIIVPGVGFDKNGYRVGYGGGYYDRFLPKLLPNVPTVALAFEIQLISQAPKDKYDFPVQYIATENKLIQCEKQTK